MLEEAFGLCREIRARGCAAFVAGGAVRDHLLGRPLTDVDIATDMPLAQLAALFETHEVGRSKQFQTVLVVRHGRPYEITRFRRGPSPEADPLREDTAHRDFTINALLMGPDGQVVDLQGGLADLGRRVIRAVGSAEERFAEDPVRVLRAVRLATGLGFDIERQTAQAVAACARRLPSVAGERIGGEILKMASQSGAALAEGVELLERFGLLRLVLPEVADLQGLEQPVERHPEGDAWRHTLAALRCQPRADPAVNLAVLLHDVGKKPAQSVEEGRHRYRGHESAGAGLVEGISRRLFLPQRLRSAIVFAVEHHGRARRLGELRRSKRLALLCSGHWPVLRALALCDVGARGESAAVWAAEALFFEAERDAAAEGAARGGAAAISGTRIMELTGLGPGPRVGQIQRRVRAWALDNAIEDAARVEAEVLRVAVATSLDPAEELPE